MFQRYKGIAPRVHPTAWVHPAAVVIGDVEIGPHVSIWPGVILRGDCGKIVIGAHSNVQDGSVVHTTGGFSETHVGERCTIGHTVILHGCRIGNDCLIGMHSTVLDNAVIGDHSIVAAGAVVTIGKQFPPRSMLMGSPAKVVREVSAANLEQIDFGWRAYQDYAAPHQNGEVETLPDDWSGW
jgi:carbonic anhydrase/acetyltransferase-like protein (isoleucine patch superfamily)